MGWSRNVVVDNRPDLVMQGKDPQLEKAVELVMKEVQAHPPQIPSPPPDLPAYPAK